MKSCKNDFDINFKVWNKEIFLKETRKKICKSLLKFRKMIVYGYRYMLPFSKSSLVLYQPHHRFHNFKLNFTLILLSIFKSSAFINGNYNNRQLRPGMTDESTISFIKFFVLFILCDFLTQKKKKYLWGKFFWLEPIVPVKLMSIIIISNLGIKSLKYPQIKQ